MRDAQGLVLFVGYGDFKIVEEEFICQKLALDCEFTPLDGHAEIGLKALA